MYTFDFVQYFSSDIVREILFCVQYVTQLYQSLIWNHLIILCDIVIPMQSTLLNIHIVVSMKPFIFRPSVIFLSSCAV